MQPYLKGIWFLTCYSERMTAAIFKAVLFAFEKIWWYDQGMILFESQTGCTSYAIMWRCSKGVDLERTCLLRCFLHLKSLNYGRYFPKPDYSISCSSLISSMLLFFAELSFPSSFKSAERKFVREICRSIKGFDCFQKR